MTHPTTECALTGRILRYLNRISGCRAVKQAGGPYGRRGNPDILGCWRGQAFFLEVKRPGEARRVTALQRRELERWEAVGAVVGVVTSVGEALGALGLVEEAPR